ncbi:(2Fe-2S)-binding protein [Hoeflea sp. YIM 152468]|uniref:(2Fe-2S)-binding protein n=1 Tax=Hoeflea sp. YIM 152468 TaxID=3031759 RepID=UPI0023DABCD6|nr:(2Fe-2S)-binding protein [Hoeflea sp. YIM 152468]MDF1609080.1 (2Fe-2S)-binding protein [Hoeflea sp. YIM 152468]
MIVCSCNVISRTDIEEVIVDFLNADEWQLITPGKVYQAMNARGKCCGCFPGVIDIIVETTQRYHALMQSPEPRVVDLLNRIADQRLRLENANKRSAAKRQSNMVA